MRRLTMWLTGICRRPVHGSQQQRATTEKLAREVAVRLTERLQQRRVHELQIAAAPRFLGPLRNAVSQQMAATGTPQMDRDLGHEGAAALALRFAPSRPTQTFKI